MSIGGTVKEVLDKMAAGDVELALRDATIALDATAGKMYPNLKGNKARFLRFVDENVKFITGFTFHSTVFTGRLSMTYPDPRSATGTSLQSFGDVLYDIRCHSVHEAVLPESVVIDDNCLGAGKPFRLIRTIPVGLAAAVVAAHVNYKEQLPLNYSFVVGRRHARVADYWGQGVALWDWFESARKAMVESDEYKAWVKARADRRR